MKIKHVFLLANFLFSGIALINCHPQENTKQNIQSDKFAIPEFAFIVPEAALEGPVEKPNNLKLIHADAASSVADNVIYLHIESKTKKDYLFNQNIIENQELNTFTKCTLVSDSIDVQSHPTIKNILYFDYGTNLHPTKISDNNAELKPNVSLMNIGLSLDFAGSLENLKSISKIECLIGYTDNQDTTWHIEQHDLGSPRWDIDEKGDYYIRWKNVSN